MASSRRWLLGSIVGAGRGVRLTGDRSVVVRTFQLEDGVLRVYDIRERESEEEKERSMAGKGLASWIGDAERGRKELKQAWREIQWCDSIGWGRHAYGLARAWSELGKTRVCVDLWDKWCLVASCISPSVCTVQRDVGRGRLGDGACRKWWHT